MITNVIALYNYCSEMLKISLRKFDLGDEIRVVIESAIVKLDHYYDKVSPMVEIALILDPTLRREFLRNGLGWKPEWMLSVEQNFKSLVLLYKGAAIASDTRESSAQEDGDGEAVSYENYLKRKRNFVSDAGYVPSEYDRYLSLPLLSRTNTDALQFWKANTFNFPTLAAMVKDYLTVQASSGPSERAFSSTDLVTSNRHIF
jgi:hypothetical protein